MSQKNIDLILIMFLIDAYGMWLFVVDDAKLIFFFLKQLQFTLQWQ